MRKLFATVRRILIALPVVAAVVVASVGGAGAVTAERVVSEGGIEAWFVRDTSVPLLSVEFLFRGGAALDPEGKGGLANLTASLLDEGAGDLDSQAYQARLQNLSIQLHFNADYDTFGGSLKTLSRNRDEAIRLLRLALLEARSPYAAPVEAVCALLPGPSPEDAAAARALARGGPPREQVGLDLPPFAAAPSSRQRPSASAAARWARETSTGTIGLNANRSLTP